MKTMLNTYTPTITEAAQAVSVPCRHLLVVDEKSRRGFPQSLAERCAR